jgi:hypothetical protein
MLLWGYLVAPLESLLHIWQGSWERAHDRSDLKKSLHLRLDAVNSPVRVVIDIVNLPNHSKASDDLDASRDEKVS